jgi:hypothetical protein
MNIPLRLVLSKDFPLCVVSDDPFIDEAAYVKALCTELRHGRWQWLDLDESFEVNDELRIMSNVTRHFLASRTQFEGEHIIGPECWKVLHPATTKTDTISSYWFPSQVTR